MKIISLIENTTNSTTSGSLCTEHGLSLYIETDEQRKILFDMGQGELFAQNASKLNISIENIDTAVISHGHYDHGGGLETFLNINSKAKIFIHRDAFIPHYSMKEYGLKYIGLDRKLSLNPRIEFCDGTTIIEENKNCRLLLFSDVKNNICPQTGNRLLFTETDKSGETVNDNFTHEQNLMIDNGNKSLLFAGCAHCGIVNIMHKAEIISGHAPAHVFAGMHLMKNGLDEKEENLFIEKLANELMKYKDTTFYTMHCTGVKQYEKLKRIMGKQIRYFSCGDIINL